ncbi:hypothetical protein G3I23_40125, partial [Streptomyces sp. SID10115]|nr:hypothetical protein [Streptomyces sp. SID10115]
MNGPATGGGRDPDGDGGLVVVRAREASARELAVRLRDRLRERTERAAHRGAETGRVAP